MTLLWAWGWGWGWGWGWAECRRSKAPRPLASQVLGLHRVTRLLCHPRPCLCFVLLSSNLTIIHSFVYLPSWAICYIRTRVCPQALTLAWECKCCLKTTSGPGLLKWSSTVPGTTGALKMYICLKHNTEETNKSYKESFYLLHLCPFQVRFQEVGKLCAKN